MTRIVRGGDSALTLELEDVIDPAVNARAVAAAAAVRTARVAGVRDVVAAFRSVTVYFDPVRTDVGSLEQVLSRAAASAPGARTPGRERRLPVCYGGDLGPDIGEVAAFAGLSEDDVVQRHTAPAYRVFMLGFVPGFAYLGVVDDVIAMARRPVPRTRVPAGSVAIAGRQTGVYPCDTPGGWRVIGRTPVRLFDAGREEPSLLAPGDAVRFDAIDRSTFDRLDGGR